MARYFFAGGIQKYLSRDKKDLILMEKIFLLVYINQANQHLAAKFLLDLLEHLLHFLTYGSQLAAKLQDFRQRLFWSGAWALAPGGQGQAAQ